MNERTSFAALGQVILDHFLLICPDRHNIDVNVSYEAARFTVPVGVVAIGLFDLQLFRVPLPVADDPHDVLRGPIR